MERKKITKALLKGDMIIIESNFLKHLLNCLKKQREISEHISDCSYKSEQQKIIDDAWKKGVQIFSGINNKKEKEIK